jgi:hypothetical protein
MGQKAAINPEEKFLTEWTAAYLEADVRDRGTPQTAAGVCLEDAGCSGISAEALTKAAGGDLAAYLRRALSARISGH